MPIKQTENPEITRNQYEHQREKVLSDAKSSETLSALISGPREIAVLDIDGIPVEIYEPSPRQLLPLQKITAEIAKFQVSAKKMKTSAETSDEITEDLLSAIVDGLSSVQELAEVSDRLLADLTVDPMLSYDAFASGLISESKKAKILVGIQNWNREKTKKKGEMITFRGNRKRAGVTRSNSGDGMEPGTVSEDA